MVRLSCFCASFTYYCDAAFFCANCLTFLVNFAFFCVILPCPALHVISLLLLHFFLHSYSGGKFVEGPLKLGHCLIRWKAKLRFLEGDPSLAPVPTSPGHNSYTLSHAILLKRDSKSGWDILRYIASVVYSVKYTYIRQVSLREVSCNKGGLAF